ncbi:VRR-NUC domain-containing protein [Burkholderia gladioli]|uniref:VRR-NUC domain-containing protein n=1 Tax=Burkholderia gladioli TaxID=28095 RepID=UPI001C27B785|nr:VRR-NUC domain-containing protein [Burkholderia gladioli]MBU9378736.1 VRR-NUC domain-containing protein [Burkholderia gladioli]
MLEKTVEAYLVERVRALGGTAYKFTSPARASVPDRIVILPPGRAYFVEVKRPGGKLTRGQEREHEHLRRLGADVRVLDSIGAINAFLNGVQAVAANGSATDDLLQLDVLLAAFHKAVWDGAQPENPMDYDLAGKDEAKAIQAHVRTMFNECAAVPLATADERETFVEILRDEQQHIAADRDMCDPDDELPRWDALQRVIDYLKRAAVSPAMTEQDLATEEEGPDDESAREEAYFRRWPDNDATRVEKPATADSTWKAPKQHCQNGGDVCLAGNRDGVCCPEESCDIDDGLRKNQSTDDERAAFEVWLEDTSGFTEEDEAIAWAAFRGGFNDGRKTAAPARIEALRKGLFNARDALRSIYEHGMTSNTPIWQWIEDANRVLNGEQAAAPAEACEPVATLHDDGHYVWNTKVPKPEGYDRAGWKMAVYGVPADAGEAVARAYPDALTEDLRHVLGFPNFRCGPYAHLMRAAGADIQRKAEDEQAHVLHWLVKLVIDHGERWADVAQEELDAMREKVAGHQGAQGGKGGEA